VTGARRIELSQFRGTRGSLGNTIQGVEDAGARRVLKKKQLSNNFNY
jgi:hypothetical protein